jgi:hypothetical protein
MSEEVLVRDSATEWPGVLWWDVKRREGKS